MEDRLRITICFPQLIDQRAKTSPAAAREGCWRYATSLEAVKNEVEERLGIELLPVDDAAFDGRPAFGADLASCEVRLAAWPARPGAERQSVVQLTGTRSGVTERGNDASAAIIRYLDGAWYVPDRLELLEEAGLLKPVRALVMENIVAILAPRWLVAASEQGARCSESCSRRSSPIDWPRRGTSPIRRPRSSPNGASSRGRATWRNRTIGSLPTLRNFAVSQRLDAVADVRAAEDRAVAGEPIAAALTARMLRPLEELDAAILASTLDSLADQQRDLRERSFGVIVAEVLFGSFPLRASRSWRCFSRSAAESARRCRIRRSVNRWTRFR